MPRLRAASRGSALARWQTDHVAGLLKAQQGGLEVETIVVETTGDVLGDTPIHELGGKGVFVKEVQAAVLAGEADIAVHSAKDLPSSTLDGLVLAAVPLRADPRDALVGTALSDLAQRAIVGTGSVRRRAQLSHLRRDLVFAELRGNIPTRLRKAPEFDAIVVAVAALDRLGLEPDVVDRLGVNVLVPQVGQGALAVECRAGDEQVLEALAGIEDPSSRLAVDAERAFLAELGGGCDLPAAAYGTVDDGEVALEAMIAAPDGAISVRERSRGRDPVGLGADLARVLLDERGGRELLESV